MSKRIVYMGTPAFACPTLAALAARPDTDVALVVTQPDRPSGRGRNLQAPPIKNLAISLGLPVYQTPSLRTGEQRRSVVDARPDLIVVAAFGLILGRSVLSLAPLGCVNLHASILPQYRGASPISAAIMNGDAESGVTLMQMERGLDTGPILAIARDQIRSDDTTESLTERLATRGATLLTDNLDALFAGELVAQPQPAGATLTRPLVKADGWIDWTRQAIQIERQVRAMWPWPRAWTSLPDGTTMQIHRANVVDTRMPGRPGVVRQAGPNVHVICGRGALQLDVAQLAGRNPFDGQQLARLRELGDEPTLGAGDPPGMPGPLIVQANDVATSRD